MVTATFNKKAIRKNSKPASWPAVQTALGVQQIDGTMDAFNLYSANG